MIFAMDFEDAEHMSGEDGDANDGCAMDYTLDNNWVYRNQDEIKDVYYFIQEFMNDNYMSFRKRVTFFDFLTFLETQENFLVPKHYSPKPVVLELYDRLARTFDVVRFCFRQEAVQVWIDKNI